VRCLVLQFKCQWEFVSQYFISILVFQLKNTIGLQGTYTRTCLKHSAFCRQSYCTYDPWNNKMIYIVLRKSKKQLSIQFVSQYFISILLFQFNFTIGLPHPYPCLKYNAFCRQPHCTHDPSRCPS